MKEGRKEVHEGLGMEGGAECGKLQDRAGYRKCVNVDDRRTRGPGLICEILRDQDGIKMVMAGIGTMVKKSGEKGFDGATTC